jgi:hypothetical protein
MLAADKSPGTHCARLAACKYFDCAPGKNDAETLGMRALCQE